MLRYLKLLGLLLSVFNPCNGQRELDTSGLDVNGDALLWYDEQINGDRAIHQIGEQFSPSKVRGDGDFPFLYESFMDGTLCYKGEYYPSVPLHYDIVVDMVLIKKLRFVDTFIEARQDEIDSFSIEGRKFVRLEIESDGYHRNAFYEVLYEGNHVSLITKRIKKEELDGYNRKDRFYILENSTAERVKSNFSLKRYFSENRKQIRRFISENELNARKSERDMIDIINHADSLF